MAALRLLRDFAFWPAAILVALACAIAGLAAQAGGFSLTLDVAAHFAPFWLAGAAAAALASLVFRGWRRTTLAAVGLVGVVAAGLLILPEYLRDTGPHAPPTAAGRLKVVQLNAWYGNPDRDRILRWLAAERPDVAVIEENPWRFRRTPPLLQAWQIACRHCEVMILSRTPPLEVASTWRAGGPRAPLTRAVYRDGRGLYEVIGVHQAWPTDDDQPYQERRLAAAIAQRPRERLIVTGDFNSAPWSFQRRRWDKAFGLVRRERAIPSWPAQAVGRLPWLGAFLPIDHVFAGPGWATVSARRGPRLSSDHYPLVVTLAPVAPR